MTKVLGQQGYCLASCKLRLHPHRVLDGHSLYYNGPWTLAEVDLHWPWMTRLRLKPAIILQALTGMMFPYRSLLKLVFRCDHNNSNARFDAKRREVCNWFIQCKSGGDECRATDEMRRWRVRCTSDAGASSFSPKCGGTN